MDTSDFSFASRTFAILIALGIGIIALFAIALGYVDGILGPLSPQSRGAGSGTDGSSTGTVSSVGIVIGSVAPTRSAIGTNVTIRGSGFTDDNTVLFGGLVAAQGVPLDPPTDKGQALTVTIPQSLSPSCTPGILCVQSRRIVTAGIYAVSVRNVHGSSNAIPLIIQ